MKHEQIEAERFAETGQSLDIDSHGGVSALVALLGGSFRDAVRECKLVISDANTSPELRAALVFIKGCAHAMQGEFEDSEHDFSGWITRDESDSSLGYKFRADTYEHLGDWENALADLNQAILRTQASSLEALELHFHRAAIWSELGELDAAIQDYETVVGLNPQHPTAVLHLLLLKQGSGSALEIAALLREKEREMSGPVSEPEPTLETALDRLVAADLEGALEMCEWLSENRPEEVNTVFVKGLAKDLRGRRFSEAGDAAAAENDYRAAIRDYSVLLDNHSDSHFTTLTADRRGQLRLAIGSQESLAGAIADFSHVIDRDAQNVLAYIHRGQSYLARYDYEEANADFNRVFDFNPENSLASLAYELNGTVALLNSRHADAVGLFEVARDYCEDPATEIHLKLFQAAGEYLQTHYEAALALLREIEGGMSVLQGQERYAFEQKLALLQTHLRPEMEASKVPEEGFLVRVKAECDTRLKHLYDLFSPETPALVPA